MRRRQMYAVEDDKATPIPKGWALCPYCKKQFKTRGMHHHKIKCKRLQG